MFIQFSFSVPFLALLLSCTGTTFNQDSPNILENETITINDSLTNKENIALYGIDSLAIELEFTVKEQYTTTKKDIATIRTKYATNFPNSTDSIVLDSIAQFFTETILNRIVPHWYGTPWDFEGHTSIPNHGEIACGYFVSTILSHMGIIVNRYKLAQQNPRNEAISIALDSNKVSNIPNSQITTHLMQLKEGLYFIGLDNHVGYLLKRNGVSYFLHSNYTVNRVMIEKVDDSQAFCSNSYFIADITHNRELMKKWLTKSEVVVFKG